MSEVSLKPRRLRPSLVRSVIWTLLALFAVLGSVGAVLWYNAPPELPAIAMQDADPAVVAAIEEAETAVRSAPHSSAAWGRLGMVLLAHDFPAEATVCLARAERGDSHEPRWPYFQALALCKEKPEEAEPKLRRAIQLQGEGSVTPKLRLAELLLGQGSAAEADELFRAVVKRYPDERRAHLGLARLATRSDQIDEARSELKTCLSDIHCRVAAHVLLSTLERRAGNTEASSRAERRARQLPADQPWPDPLAEEYQQLATGRQAISDRVNNLLDAGRLDEALALLDRAVAEYPDSDWLWMLHGRALLKKHEPDRARQSLLRALTLNARSSAAYRHLGFAALQQSQPAEAAAHFRKVIELGPDAQAYALLGAALAKCGKETEAIDAFEQGLRLKPDDTASRIECALLLARQGRRVEACQQVHAVLEADPGNPQAQRLLVQFGGRPGLSDGKGQR